MTIRTRWCCYTAALVLATLLTGAADEGEGKSSDILEVMAWCKGVNDGMDWNTMLRVAKTECDENDDDDGILRVKCSSDAVGYIVNAARMIVDASATRAFACANGLAFVLAVALVYGRQDLSSREVARSQALLWSSLQENFLMDASVWPVKTYDVLQLFDRFPAALNFPDLGSPGLDAVTVVVPRCPIELAEKLKDILPGMKFAVGLEKSEPEDLPRNWNFYSETFNQPTGMVLNQMLANIGTPFSLIILGGALPVGIEDVERMIRVLTSRRVAAVGGPLVDSDRVYSDFCHQTKLRHYRLGFDSVYEHSVIFDEESAASIRGSWFREEGDLKDKDGPCKLCDTLPPTFLARTEAVYAIGFHPMLDSEWALLDFGIRASHSPLVEVRRPEDEQARGWSPPEGLRHGKVPLALCPFVNIREVPGFGGPHLYGRRDRPPSGVSPLEAWFGSDSSALGHTAGNRPGLLRPQEQFKAFMEVNALREFVGTDGITRHAGCQLSTTNCPVPNWVYRGWAAPTCCKETMRHLLFYISDVFTEMGIRFIITDGVLLGSYKFGGMLDWDADVDLHIHDEDFHRLDSDVQQRVAADGHHLRKHVNNNSWLLQANDHNYLLIELNKRSEPWDPEKVWHLPVEGRLFPAMEDAHLNLSSWYGLSFFQHRLRHVPEWEEASRPMYCATPYHHNCVDATQVPSGADCQRAGVC